MIDGLKPYPAVKDSGVEWLGDVPEHWRILPALAAYRPRQVKNAGLIEKAVLSLSYGKIVIKPPEKLRGLVPESFETYQIVEPGNIIVRTTDLQNDQTSRRVAHAHHRGIITAAYMCLETSAVVSNEFGYQYLNAYDLLKIIYGYGSGLRQNLDFSDIKRMPVLVPPSDEQAAIVRFLNHLDRRMRRCIRAKQKLVKLLEEQKQAIIHRAVTRGLDPNVRLKSSGVEWLGDVPEHWEELPLKRVSRLDNSGNYGVEPEQGEEVLPVATTAQIDRDGRFDAARMPRRGFTRAEVRRYGCRPGDILVVKSSGSIFNVISGKAGIVRADTPRFVFSNFLMRIVADPSAIEPEYLFLLLSGYLTRERVKRMVAGTTYPNLRVGEYVSAVVPVPPIPEQRSIVRAVSMMTAAVDHAVRSAQTETDLLREYGTRLIADVVTGKLDVREAAARLPDEVEEPEPLDELEANGDTDDAGVDDTDVVPEEVEA